MHTAAGSGERTDVQGRRDLRASAATLELVRSAKHGVELNTSTSSKRGTGAQRAQYSYRGPVVVFYDKFSLKSLQGNEREGTISTTHVSIRCPLGDDPPLTW